MMNTNERYFVMFEVQVERELGTEFYYEGVVIANPDTQDLVKGFQRFSNKIDLGIAALMA